MAGLLRRNPEPPRDTRPVDVRYADLTARVDQALAEVDTALRASCGNKQLVDVLLDIKNALTRRRTQA